MIPLPGLTSEGALAEGFAAFMATARSLEDTYTQLQSEVARLRAELEDRNAALASSVAQNRGIRTALHRILDAMPCGVIVIDDTNDIVVFTNPEAQKLVGIPVGPALHLRDLVPPVQALLRSAILRDDEYEFCIESGRRVRWLSVRKRQVHVEFLDQGTHNASVEQSILILRDVTYHKEAERERETSRNMVALGEMAAVLAHEVRNPLGSMELLAELLAQHGVTEGEPRQWIEHLQAGMRSLSATVNNVLQLHGSGSVNLFPIQLSAVLENGLRFVRPLADQAGISLTLHNELENAEIAGDAGGLQQVILNLAINAFRHTPAGGSLDITARIRHTATSRLASVTFADTGSGISAEHISKIFDPGFSTSNQSPGIGLTICLRIVQQHRGTIEVSSQVGAGATFALEFPVL
jgi:signal transduction histidine kinase